MSDVLHRLPAVADIILTREYLQFAQQVMASHDKANKQSDLDVSPAMGDMVTEMQGCFVATELCQQMLDTALWQLCYWRPRSCGADDR